MISLFDRLTGQTPAQPDRQLELVHLGRDIENLLNHPRESVALQCEPILARSFLNYGLPSLVGKRVEAITLGEIADQIRLALVRFEPRLDASSIVVARSPEQTGDPGVLVFAVQARLSEHNNDVRLHLRFDVNFGRASVHKLDVVAGTHSC
jgi:type VI secretion system protein ImpF